MRFAHRLVLAIATALVLGFNAGPIRADYILGGGEFFGTYRIEDDGTLVGYYTPPLEEVEESYGEDFVVTPDLQTLYQFTNALGISTVIFGFDVDTRAHLPEKKLHSGFGFFPDVTGDAIVNAHMPLIRPNDPQGAGDLFVISALFGYPSDAEPQIKRYDRETDSYVESIDPPTPQGIYDFAFGPDNRLYMAVEDGIFVYEESASGFELLSTTPLIVGVTGTITFGQDGRLYLRNVVTGNIDRYTISGALFDTFIPAESIPDGGGSAVGEFFAPGRGSIQFGVDGNLHLLASGKIGKYDGTTGNLMSLVPLPTDPLFPEFAFGAKGRVTYLPVPEGASLLLATFAMAFAICGIRRR